MFDKGNWEALDRILRTPIDPSPSPKRQNYIVPSASTPYPTNQTLPTTIHNQNENQPLISDEPNSHGSNNNVNCKSSNMLQSTTISLPRPKSDWTPLGDIVNSINIVSAFSDSTCNTQLKLPLKSDKNSLASSNQCTSFDDVHDMLLTSDVSLPKTATVISEYLEGETEIPFSNMSQSIPGSLLGPILDQNLFGDIVNPKNSLPAVYDYSSHNRPIQFELPLKSDQKALAPLNQFGSFDDGHDMLMIPDESLPMTSTVICEFPVGETEIPCSSWNLPPNVPVVYTLTPSGHLEPMEYLTNYSTPISIPGCKMKVNEKHYTN